MPRYICKLQDGDKVYYMEWSAITDTPATFGLSLEEFKEYYQEAYGTQGMLGLPERLERVDKTGTSCYETTSVDDLIAYNTAGKNDTTITKEQIIEGYCRRNDIPVGTSPNEEVSS